MLYFWLFGKYDFSFRNSGERVLEDASNKLCSVTPNLNSRCCLKHAVWISKYITVLDLIFHYQENFRDMNFRIVELQLKKDLIQIITVIIMVVVVAVVIIMIMVHITKKHKAYLTSNLNGFLQCHQDS